MGESRVERVELFEDRVSVTRVVDLPADAGRTTLLLEGLSPLVRESALAFLSEAGAVVEEAEVHRLRVPRSEVGDEGSRALRDRREAVEDQVRRLDARTARLAEAAQRSSEVAATASAWAPRALGVAPDATAWVEAFRRLAEDATARRLEALEHAREVRLLHAELEALTERERAAQTGRSALVSNLRLVVRHDGAGVLRVRYTLPCALWRPVHRAVLRGGRIAWEVGAMVWNATGEDWPAVALVCSTARPSERAEPPVLVDDVVQARPRDREVVVETREEEIEVAREGAARRTTQLPGVDDGGETRTFTAPDPVDVPSDGRPVHVVLERWEADAESRWIAHPELSPQVVLTSRQVNAGTRPLLAGPVALFRENGAVGRGQVDLVPPGEPFALGWGSHDEVRITRRRDQETSRARITGRQSWRFQVQLRVAHVGREPIEVLLRERVPVSELDAVDVAPPSAEPTLSDGPDRDGVCTWRLTLEPRSVRELELGYTVEAASNVRLPF